MADPAAPADVREAGADLRYRDFLTVALVIEGEDPFPDNWIYIHEPDVEVGRIQNFRSWSPWMVPDPDTGCVGMEYFCFQGDRLWNMADEDLVALASSELEQLGLVKPAQVKRGYAVRVPLAYPMYDETTPSRSRRSVSGSTRSRASSRSVATACTGRSCPACSWSRRWPRPPASRC